MFLGSRHIGEAWFTSVTKDDLAQAVQTIHMRRRAAQAKYKKDLISNFRCTLISASGKLRNLKRLITWNQISLSGVGADLARALREQHSSPSPVQVTSHEMRADMQLHSSCIHTQAALCHQNPTMLYGKRKMPPILYLWNNTYAWAKTYAFYS